MSKLLSLALLLSACGGVGAPSLRFEVADYAVTSSQDGVVQTTSEWASISARPLNPMSSVQINVAALDVAKARTIAHGGGPSVAVQLDRQGVSTAASGRGEANIRLTAVPNIQPGFAYRVEALDMDSGVASEPLLIWLIDAPGESLEGN